MEELFSQSRDRRLRKKSITEKRCHGFLYHRGGQPRPLVAVVPYDSENEGSGLFFTGWPRPTAEDEH